MRISLWPRSLATRTALVLLLGLVLVQMAGLTIHALDRIDLQRLAQARDVSLRVMGLYRTLVLTPPAERDLLLREMEMSPGFNATVTAAAPDVVRFAPVQQPLQRLLRLNMNVVPVPAGSRPANVQILNGDGRGQVLIVMRLPDEAWLTIATTLGDIRPWHSEVFLFAFVVMTVAAVGLVIWSVRRLTTPVRTLALAAEALGRDVNAPPLPEDGPTEIATASAAFNTMAARIRRFVQDRTELLTAIGHDLRTPITRLKLRAEFIEDDEQRRKMLNDLEELEAMVSATLAFGRDAKTAETVSALDLAEMLRTVLDEAGDARPDAVDRLAYAGPRHLTVRARPLALKRALVNLVANALAYAGNARVSLDVPGTGMVRVCIEDDGPGVPPDQLDRVFEPFHRLESSRNRETGGVGLGLPIARNILRAHGGDVLLGNRPAGGLLVTVLLPA